VVKFLRPFLFLFCGTHNHTANFFVLNVVTMTSELSSSRKGLLDYDDVVGYQCFRGQCYLHLQVEGINIMCRLNEK
jgi:hypothetical protein